VEIKGREDIMGYPLTTEYYIREERPYRIVRKRPKFPKGKANIKAEKRRTHQKRYYLRKRMKKTVEAFINLIPTDC
jgi:hypothetical protein